LFSFTLGQSSPKPRPIFVLSARFKAGGFFAGSLAERWLRHCSAVADGRRLCSARVEQRRLRGESPKEPPALKRAERNESCRGFAEDCPSVNENDSF